MVVVAGKDEPGRLQWLLGVHVVEGEVEAGRVAVGGDSLEDSQQARSGSEQVRNNAVRSGHSAAR